MEWQRQTRKCFEVTGFCVSLDHFSRSIILSRLGVDQSYTRNLPTQRGGRRRKTRRGEQKKILSLSDKRHTTPAFSSFIFHFQTYFRNCSELNQVQKTNILWLDGVSQSESRAIKLKLSNLFSLFSCSSKNRMAKSGQELLRIKCQNKAQFYGFEHFLSYPTLHRLSVSF